MYNIERTSYGLRLEFGGLMSDEELKTFFDDFESASSRLEGPFTVFVDMRTLVPLSREAMPQMLQCQQLARECGMTRSVVIFTNPATIQQFKRIAGESGIHHSERYLDASQDPEWESNALAWLIHGVEPPKNILKSTIF